LPICGTGARDELQKKSVPQRGSNVTTLETGEKGFSSKEAHNFQFTRIVAEREPVRSGSKQ